MAAAVVGVLVKKAVTAAAAAASATVQTVRRRSALVDAAVLFQVIPTAETFGADGARERPQSGVDPLVSGQFFVASERLSAGFFVAFEWSFTFKDKKRRNS